MADLLFADLRHPRRPRQFKPPINIENFTDKELRNRFMKKSRHEPFSMHNVNPEGQGVGGSTGRSENVGQFFLEWERRINLTNVAKNPSQRQNTN